jgi:RNA polymerase sigma factor (sigma-70 family)
MSRCYPVVISRALATSGSIFQIRPVRLPPRVTLILIEVDMERILENVAAATIVIPPIPTTDGELLMQFARHGDQAAFAQLVQKHGRLVWTVCWQVLRQHHEIEDAFQSTFFILAKRARSIRSCDSLCGWLYRVAYRTALRSRMSAKAKRVSDLGIEVDTMEEWSALDDKLHAIEQDEQRSALLEELQALPEKYQQVLALCYLEGKTRRAIADELGCSLETVKGRLARGRQVLRHRLIRRGVSLSLAMAAMTLPVKSATAAITPSLIGLTVTGATAWAAGTLGTAKIVSGAGAAKVVCTASTQVIHLAHQGTIAMTIASFAKPAVLAVALLGAVSATLAVDSADAPEAGAVQVVDLQAGGEAGETSEPLGDIVIEGGAPAVIVTMAEEPANADKKKIHRVEAFAFEFAGEKKRVPAPPRAPKTIAVTAPDQVEIPDVFVPTPTDFPVAQPFNLRVPKLDLNLHLKMAQLESRVSQLQLESKKLEIASFGAEGQQKEKLIEASREKLLEAEAEKLKIQIEQQEEQIRALEQAIEQQTKQIGKQAAKMMEADVVAEHAARIELKAERAVEAAAAQAAVQAKIAAAHADQAAKWQIQKPAFVVDPASGATISADPAGSWEAPIQNQEGALSLKPGDRVQIEVVDTVDEGTQLVIDGAYTIEPMGTIALGAAYGRAHVAGMSVIDAEQSLIDQLRKVFKNPKIQVTFVERPQPHVSYTPTTNTPAKTYESRPAPDRKAEPSKTEESR